MTEEKPRYGPAFHIEGGKVDPAGVEAVAKVIGEILSAPHADESTKAKALEVLTSHAVVRDIRIEGATVNQGHEPSGQAIHVTGNLDEESE